MNWSALHAAYMAFGITVGTWLFVTAVRNYLSSGNPFGRSAASPVNRRCSRRCFVLRLLKPIRDWTSRVACGWSDPRLLPACLSLALGLIRKDTCLGCGKDYFSEWSRDLSKAPFCPKCREQQILRHWHLPSGEREGYFAKVWSGWGKTNRFLVTVVDSAGGSHSHWYLALSAADRRYVDFECVRILLEEQDGNECVGPYDSVPGPTNLSTDFETLCLPDGSRLEIAEKAYNKLRELMGGSVLGHPSGHVRLHDLDLAIQRIREHWNPSRSFSGSTHSGSTHSGSTHSGSTRRTPAPRLWSRQNIRADLEGVSWAGDASRVWLKKRNGEQISFLFTFLSADDQEYARITCPPRGSRGGWSPARSTSSTRSDSTRRNRTRQSDAGSQATAGKRAQPAGGYSAAFDRSGFYYSRCGPEQSSPDPSESSRGTPSASCPDDVLKHYDTLGLAPYSDSEVVEQRYRELSLTHHPDLNQGDAASLKRTKEINLAVEKIREFLRCQGNVT